MFFYHVTNEIYVTYVVEITRGGTTVPSLGK